MIYLDHHSATRPCLAALEKMTPYLQEQWGPLFAPHRMGSELTAVLESRYQMIYDSFSASAKDPFVFTSSGAEAINQVFWSLFVEVARKEGKCHFITSCIEDAPTMQSCKRLEELGCFIKIAPVDQEGKIDLNRLAELINPRTALISIGMAHGLTGVIQPIEEISLLAKEKNVLLHLDATYAVGKLMVSLDQADYLTFSGDRIHAVKGSGGLLVKEGRPLAPLIVGGNEQGALRGGALDIPSLMALTAALQQSHLYLDAMSLEVARLRDLLEIELQQQIPDVKPLYTESLRLPNTTTILFPRIHQEALLYMLNRKGVYATIGGPYCQHLHRVLIASGISELDAECAISFSLSRMTTEAEIRKAAELIAEAVRLLQPISEEIFR